MDKDSELCDDEEISVGGRSIDNKIIEDVENNQNLINYSVSQTQLKEENQNDQQLQDSSIGSKNTIIIEKDDLESNNENEEELNFFNNRRNRKSKITAIFDSDSENEEENLHSVEQNDENCNENSPNSETCELKQGLKNIDENEIQSKKPRRIALIDSDSDESGSNVITKLSEEHEEEQERADIHVNEENPTLLDVEEMQLIDQRKILSNLCDSESSDDNSNDDDNEHGYKAQISDSEVEALQGNPILKSKSRKSKPRKSDLEKQTKMTAKKALEQKKEIFSESQRRIRESRISLPYHKPKPRSLKEFLENRPKLTSPLTNVYQTASPSAAIKMSMEQLEVVSKKLKEREKEVQEFYKSESESESENENMQTDSVDVELDVQTQEPEVSDICANNQSKTEEKNNSEFDQVEHFNLNNDNISADINDGENIEKSEVKNSLDTILNCNESREITSTLSNVSDIEDAVNCPLNSEEVDHSLETTHSNEVNQDEIEENSKKDCMDTSDLQNPISDVLMDQIEEKEIEFDIQKEPQIETELTHQKKDEVVNMEINDTKEVEKAEDTLGSSTDGNSVERGKLDNLVILSNVILQPSNSKEPNFYNLNDELLDLSLEVQNNKRESDKYDFNLDDIEDEFEHVNEEVNETKVETIDENKCQLRKNRKQELLEKLGSLKPRLSGGPNEVIDLENGLTMPDEVSKLRERFLQHNMKIGKHKHKKEISILSVTDGKIYKETVALNVDEDDEESTAPLEKPGVRLQKLREELEHQMAQRRSNIWKERHNPTIKNKEENNEEKSDDEKSNCGIDNILDNEEEEELTESEIEDEELEENDYDMSEKKERKSAFVDEEAEESDIEEDDAEETNFEENNEEADINEEGIEEEDEDADAEDNVEMKELEEVPKKKVLKRIITSFDNDDSDDDNDIVPYNKPMLNFSRDNRDKKVSSDDELLPPHQPTNYKIREPVVTPTKSEIDFLTPITYMTGIQNLNTSGSRIVAPMNTSSDENSLNNSHKQFPDEAGLESQDFDENFPNTQDLINHKIITEPSSSDDFFKPPEQNYLSTQDVLEVCSGNFPASSQSISNTEISTQQSEGTFPGIDSSSQKSNFNTQDLADICSGQFTGVTQPEKQNYEDIALDESEENIISQLIDEEELERFKKKFESPVASYTQKTIDLENAKEVHGTGGVIDSEDDNDDELLLKKKKNKRLTFSDEESEDDSAEEETIDLYDKDLASNVEYDSEENEIDPEDRELDDEQQKPQKMKMSDFFENEAELSESEWGSEDEDEKNLDDMEFEKGDEEKFDDEKLRSDIERVQMRQMLDEDNREVKLLQELLLEDGELHGSGRQRQFRWKNIDSTGNEIEETKLDDGDIYLDDDDESEEQWRKMRHEREMFMLKKQSQEEDDSVLIESQRLSFTHKTIKIKSQTSVFSHTMSEEVTTSPKIKQPFSLLNKRGSFLSRSEQILQKFAETTKVSVGSKSTNRIVFQSVDGELKKRKAVSQENDSTPVALKKLRLSDLSPALQKIKPKLGKNLFEESSID